MEIIKRLGFENEIPTLDLFKIIRREAGSDSRTRSKYIKDLKEFGFIARVNPQVWIIKSVPEVKEPETF